MGYGLNERRGLPKAEKSIIRHAQDGLFSGLKAAGYLRYDNAWPPPAERVLPFMHGLIGPGGWSCTESSRIVELPLRGGDCRRKTCEGSKMKANENVFSYARGRDAMMTIRRSTSP